MTPFQISGIVLCLLITSKTNQSTYKIKLESSFSRHTFPWTCSPAEKNLFYWLKREAACNLLWRKLSSVWTNILSVNTVGQKFCIAHIPQTLQKVISCWFHQQWQAPWSTIMFRLLPELTLNIVFSWSLSENLSLNEVEKFISWQIANV